MDSIITLLISFSGGLLQSITGFGAGIIIMLALPNIFPMSVAPAVSNTICAPLSWSLTFKYRKHTRRKLIFLPAVFYILGSTTAIKLSATVNLDGLKIAFGIILVFLGLYFMFFQDKLKVTGNLLSAFICCTMSGVLSGFFGIGGPPLALYYLAVTEGKEEYLGTINGLLALTTVYQVLLRIAVGILTWSSIPYILVGVVGILFGRVVGTKIVDRIDVDKMKKAIYLFLAAAGIITISQCF